ncbi:MAG TPA: lactonase family protein [Kofleriaceae bacterium]|nr:lactonase family protein [Kofleriaceae bacterium]
MRIAWLALVVGGFSACGGSSAGTDAAGSGDGAQPDAAIPTRYVAYVSGGANIDWYDVDKSTGALTHISSIAAFRSGANFLAVHGMHLYAVTSGDRVGAYTIDPATAGLTFINDVGTGGTGVAHVSVDRSGLNVLVANYGSGHIDVIPVRGDGGLGTPKTPILAGANAHQIITDDSNHYVYVPCLGDDKIAEYLFESSTGALTASTPAQLDTANNAGPRHLALAPDRKHAYLINEVNSTLSALAIDSLSGQLSELQTVSLRASGASGTNTGAEVIVHPNNKFVYGSNRGDNNIAVFAIDQTTGMVTEVDHTSTQGMTPRNFTVDPSGTLMFVANQNSNTVVPLEIDPATGRLTPTASSVSVPTPQFVGIVELPL